MTEPFVPPSKTPAAPGSAIAADPAPGDRNAGDLDASEAEGAPPVESAAVLEPVELVDLVDAEAGSTVEMAAEPTLEGAGALALPAGAAIAAVDSVFFYGGSEASPVLYQVNLAEGSLSTVNEPVDLFSTALEGLFTSTPGGLGGEGAA
ncbi:hypothetical protein C7293_22525, partial [filamentous cyanobacterium CCT1]